MAVDHVMITLDRPRPLRFDGRAFAAFEERYGKDIGEVMADVAAKPQRKLSHRLVSHLLLAALQHRDRTLTYDSVLGLVSDGEEREEFSLIELWAKIDEALMQSGFFKLFARKVAESQDPEANEPPDPRQEAEGNGSSPTSASAIG